MSPSEIRDVFFSVSCSKKSKNNFCEKTEDTFSTNEDEGFAFASTDNSMDIDSSNWYTENSYESSLSPKKDSEYIKSFIDSFNTRKISFEINDIDALYLTSCGKWMWFCWIINLIYFVDDYISICKILAWRFILKHENIIYNFILLLWCWYITKPHYVINTNI